MPRVLVTETELAQEQVDPFIRSACKRFDVENVAIQLASDAPIGSGLGGSGAVGVALVGALATHRGKSMSPRELAELAHRIEVEDLGIIGGKQDQYAAAYGGFLALTFQGEEVEIEQLALGSRRVAQLEKRSIIVYIGQSRVSEIFTRDVREAYQQRNPSTLAALAMIRRVAREFRSALQAGPLDDLGELLNENWDAQKHLHPSTTNEVVDGFFETAKRGAHWAARRWARAAAGAFIFSRGGRKATPGTCAWRGGWENSRREF